MMKPANHIFLFRSIVNYYNIKENPLLLKKLQQQIPLPITFDIYGRAIYERNSQGSLMKESSSENVEGCYLTRNRYLHISRHIRVLYAILSHLVIPQTI